MIKRREALIGGVLLGMGSANLMLQPPGRLKPVFSGKIEDMLPTKIGDWVANDARTAILPPSDDLERAVYDQVVVRQFEKNGNTSITLMIAHSPPQSYSTQLHRPDLCYQASNFRIESVAHQVMDLSGKSIPISTMQALRGARRDLVLFWTRFGDAYPQSLWGQRFEIAKQAFFRERHDGFLVRLSVIKRDEEVDVNDLKAFAGELHNGIPRQLREQLY